jgi:hypothetical protein
MSVALSDGRHVVQQQKPRIALETLARAGYATRGALYLIVGGLAGLAAVGQGGDTTDTKGALLEVYAQPFGEVLLSLAAAGLAGYAVFLVCRAVLDPEAEARGTWGPANRAGWAFIALFPGSLALFALSMVLGHGSGAHDGGQQARGLTATVLAWRPLGPWLVAGVGIGILSGAAYDLRCAWKAKLDEHLDLSRLATAARQWVIRLSRVGIAARACVGVVAGAFLVVAAVTADPNRTKGFADSLGALRAMPLGQWLFGGAALGLIAFGCYQLIEARYRRVLGHSR